MQNQPKCDWPSDVSGAPLAWISSIRLQLRSDAGDVVIARVGPTLALRILVPHQPTTDVVWRNGAVEDAHGLLTQQTVAFLGPEVAPGSWTAP